MVLLGLLALLGAGACFRPSWAHVLFLASLGRFRGQTLASFGSHFGHIFDQFLGSVLDCVLEVLFEGVLGPKAAKAKARRGPETPKSCTFVAIYDGFGMLFFCCFQVLGLLLVPFRC